MNKLDRFGKRCGWFALALAGNLALAVGVGQANAQATSTTAASLSPLVQAAPASSSADNSSSSSNSSSALHIAPAWRPAQLPDARIPRGDFSAVLLDGEPALRLKTKRSYGTLLHPWAGAPGGRLRWQWRLDQPLPQADIRQRGGDDAALKVCAMFDQPLADMPFIERNTLRLARAASGEALPAATVCYLWDSRYAAGSSGANPYSARVRYIVLQGPSGPSGQFVTEQRDLARDFLQLFGSESAQVPPLVAIAVGADSDNTQGSSLGFLRGLSWAR